MGETDDFDEKNASDAASFLGYLDGAAVFDMNDPDDRRRALETSAFMAMATDERSDALPITDERVERAGRIVQKLIPHDPKN